MWIIKNNIHDMWIIKNVWGQKSSPQKTEYLIECYDS